MNIKELEVLTGITKQNIRFYEKKGLLAPSRNPRNDYREYTDEDVKRLKTVKLFRLLDVSMEDIRLMLEGKAELKPMMEKHIEKLSGEQERLQSALLVSKELVHQNLLTLDVENVLNDIEDISRKGGKFMGILKDYKKVSEQEERKVFSFVPDTMALNSKEFTEALLSYAKENSKDLVITKEGMYPEFQMDGVDYVADRVFGRMGAVIRCRMKNPEKAEAVEVPDKERKTLQLVHQLVGPGIGLLLVLLFWASRQFAPIALFVGVFLLFIVVVMFRFYKNLR